MWLLFIYIRNILYRVNILHSELCLLTYEGGVIWLNLLLCAFVWVSYTLSYAKSLSN
nr:MAG TPA: hypothetical protein [Caudoviricetes sp.]